MRIHNEVLAMTRADQPTGDRAAAPGQCCPRHSHIALDGGPVLFRCEPYGHSVFAADISHEFMPRERSRARW
jgi:hypothetical protein